MDGMLISSVVYRGVNRRSAQAKDYQIGICRISAKYVTLRSKHAVRTMCPSSVTYLPVDLFQ